MTYKDIIENRNTVNEASDHVYFNGNYVPFTEQAMMFVILRGEG